MRVGCKVHSLTKKELCHSTETWHALNSTFHDANCIVFFPINPYWINYLGLWTVVLEKFRERPGKLTKGVLFHGDNDFFFSHVREQKSTSSATVMLSSHCDHRLACRSIVLVKQDSLHQFSRPLTKCVKHYFSKSWITYPVWVYLEGNNAVSIRKGWI